MESDIDVYRDIEILRMGGREGRGDTSSIIQLRDEGR
jgi:hypothetical protein